MADNKTTLKAVWNGDTKGSGTIKAGHLDTKIAISESSGGTGEGAEPKEFLLSSAATCYIMTLVAILDSRELPVVDLEMDSEVTVSKEEGFKITHYPHIILSADATDKQKETAERAFTTADRGCSIGNLLKKADVQITVKSKLSEQSK